MQLLSAPLSIGPIVPAGCSAILGCLAGSNEFVSWYLLISLGILLLCGLFKFKTGAICCVFFMLCAAQIGWHQQGLLSTAQSGELYVVRGEIIALEKEAGRTKFRMSVDDCRPMNSRVEPCKFLKLTSLSWYQPPKLKLHQHWELVVKLKRIRGFKNPHSFDYEQWLWREGIQASGYVRQAPQTLIKESEDSLRLDGHNALAQVSMDATARRWLRALTLGDSDALNDADWDLVNNTGTTHLMVISGLHVGLITGNALLLLRFLARILFPKTWRGQNWPWWFAGFVSFAYAYLSGFEPPAMRAAVMAAIALWVARSRYAPGWWQAWWLALTLVLMLDPLSLWRAGFWLSFGAVATLILMWAGRVQPSSWRGWCWSLIKTQFLLAPIMTAAVLLAFDRIIPLSPLINLVAVPIVSAVLVPLAFIGWPFVFWPKLAALVWWPFVMLNHALLEFLQLASNHALQTSLPVWQQIPLVCGLLLIGLTWLIPGFSTALKVITPLAMLTAFLGSRAPQIPIGSIQLRVYDIGQGLSAEIRTHEQSVLFDSGPKFSSGFTPISTLWPSRKHFNRVIISHSDSDHAGGLESIKAFHEVDQWWAPPQHRLNINTHDCHAGVEWESTDARWQFLSPPTNKYDLTPNERSCVLLVSVGDRHVLITGDASAEQEAIFKSYLPAQGVDVLIAGHHGSKSSSSEAFIQRAKPSHAVFSSGFLNAFGHPHSSVIKRFQANNAALLNTAYDGAVIFNISQESIEVAHQRHPGWTRRELNVN